MATRINGVAEVLDRGARFRFRPSDPKQAVISNQVNRHTSDEIQCGRGFPCLGRARVSGATRGRVDSDEARVPVSVGMGARCRGTRPDAGPRYASPTGFEPVLPT